MATKKRLLIISGFPPNTRSAGQNFTKNFINSICKALDIKVDLVYFSFKDHPSEISFGKVNSRKITLTKIGQIVKALTLFWFNPLFTKRFSLFEGFRLWKCRNEFDIIILNFSQVFLYSIFFLNQRKIFVVHDVIYQKFARTPGIMGYILKIQAWLTEKFLFSVSNTYIYCFSNKDKELIAELYGKNSDVINFYLPDEILFLNLTYLEHSICLYGAWNRKENLEGLEYFLNRLLSKIIELDPSLKIFIIGGGLPESVKLKCDNHKQIFIYGFQENPYSLIASCKALVAPLFSGAGVKVKVIESLACGTPVIGNEIALEGIEFFEGIYLIKNEKEYVNTITSITQSIDLEKKKKLRQDFLSFYNLPEKLLHNKLSI